SRRPTAGKSVTHVAPSRASSRNAHGWLRAGFREVGSVRGWTVDCSDGLMDDRRALARSGEVMPGQSPPAVVEEIGITRQQLIEELNGDLSREYQAIIAYVIYSQTLKGAAYMSIASELVKHASQELAHAITIAKQIDYLGGAPTAEPQEVRTSADPRQ